MGQDEFGTLSGRLMERGTERVRAVLDEAGPEPTSVSFDLTYSSRREAKPAGPHTERAYDVPPATRTTAFAKVPPAHETVNGTAQQTSSFGSRTRDDRHDPSAPRESSPRNDRYDADRYNGDQYGDQYNGDRQRHAAPYDSSPRDERPAAHDSTPRPAGTAADEPRDFGSPAAPRPLSSRLFDASPSQTPQNTHVDAPTAPRAPDPVAVNPVGDQQHTLEARRAGSGANLTIKQPQAGDMSQVTVTMNGVSIDHSTPQKGGQAPSSVTYERRSLSELARDAEALANGERAEPVWIETPSYSGPDRRTLEVSPEIERRKSVPPRIKVSVRLEQERYLRLKLAAVNSGRTQQDIITSAIDAYLDDMGLDRFVRIAMGFGVEADGSSLDKDAPPTLAKAADGWR